MSRNLTEMNNAMAAVVELLRVARRRQSQLGNDRCAGCGGHGIRSRQIYKNVQRLESMKRHLSKLRELEHEGRFECLTEECLMQAGIDPEQ